MRHLSLILALTLVTGLFGSRSVELENRLGDLERGGAADLVEIEALRSRLLETEARLASSNARLEALREDHDRALELDTELSLRDASFEGELEETRRRLGEYVQRIDRFESRQAGTDWDERFELLRRNLEERWQDANSSAHRASELARENRSSLKVLGSRMNRDVESMWDDVMGPTVQLAGQTTVGSGVLLESQELSHGEGYRTHVLTAWHVVRDILADADLMDGPIPVTVYSRTSLQTHFEAKLLRFDPGIDAALLELNTRKRMDFGARLASREKLASMRIFDHVYAAGCPLGNDPIPTFGELADTRHLVDGEDYWMISAPTYIGNSGGGIFDAENRELVGIFSKIYTHGTLRPTVVPHMGLATPLSTIYDWLEEVGYESLVAAPRSTHARTASAEHE